jgi:nitrite reductase/ring-hydroxylating ferredoxin subunit
LRLFIQHGGPLARNQRGCLAPGVLRQAAASDTFPARISGAESMAEWFVAKASELADGDRRIVVAGKREIGVFHKDGAYHAYSNTCLHQGGPACEGLIINNVVDVVTPDRLYHGQTFGDEIHFACPWHGYEYDLQTGECIGDRKLKLRKYNVVKRGDDVFVVI